MIGTTWFAPPTRKAYRWLHHPIRIVFKYALSLLLLVGLANLLIFCFQYNDFPGLFGSYATFALANPSLALLVALMLSLAWGVIGTYFGIQYLFWQDTARARVAASFGITLFLAVIGMLAHYEYRVNVQGEQWKELHEFLLSNGVPMLALLLAPAALPGLFPEVSRTLFAYTIGRRRRRGRERLWTDYVRDSTAAWLDCFGPYVAGVALGMLLIGGVSGGADWARQHWIAPGPGAAPGVESGYLFTIGVLYVVFLVLYGGLSTVAYRLVTPAVAICVLMSLLALTITLPSHLLQSHSGWPHLPDALKAHSKLIVSLVFWTVLAGWIALANSHPYKLTFPGLERYYPGGDLGPIALGRFVRDHYFPKAGAPDSPGLLDSHAVLEAWLRRVRPSGSNGDGNGTVAGKPKLAVIAVSGGATRSAYWTAVVLDRIEREVPGFGAHVRVISGASGGMLGAAHYVKWLRDRADPQAPQRELTETIPIDSIKFVARSIALRGVILGITPRSLIRLWVRWFGPFLEDRGRHLEHHWDEIRFPFRSLRDGERTGAIPSLIFSPMIIEDGRRLLISNLDLGALTRTGGHALLDRNAGRDRLDYSLTALEFSRLFPHADDFQLSTAVRMSATFPFISPAVSLPTDPPRRVVDAGYYDNFGIQVAASWLRAHIDWLTEHTSGVILVQVRDSLSHEDRLGVADPPRGFRARLRRGFSFFLSPIEGVKRARNASCSFRNDQAVQNLSESFTLRMRGRLAHPGTFFTTVAFENSANVTFEPSDPSSWPGDHHKKSRKSTGVALNWYLSAAERESLGSAIPITPQPGSHWSCPATRLDHIAGLRDAADACEGGQRTDLLKPLEQARNFERLVQLREWWYRPGEPMPCGGVAAGRATS